MGVEFELKYTAHPRMLEEIAAAYPGDYRIFHMETTYYDTPDGKLSDRRMTLRCRMENHTRICTVKAPISGYGRGEWDCQCDKIEDAILQLCEQGAPRELLLLTVEGVEPICGAKFTRRALELRHAGSVLEIALDSGVLLGGGKEAPLCEVEVELKAGEPEAAIQFAGQLAEQFGLEPQSKSKFRRALTLAKGE